MESAKRQSVLLSVLLFVVFSFSGVVFGVELGWTGAADSSWNNPGNWSTGKVPDMYIYDDAVVNTQTNMPIVEPNQSINCDDLMLARNVSVPPATAIMTMNGGTFQLGRHFKICQDANTSGTFNMYGGTVYIYDTLMAAQRGTGYFNMYDGVVNVDKIIPCEAVAGKQGRGTLNMYGGTMNGNSLTFFTGTAPAIPLVNMAGGTLVLPGDWSAYINASVTAGFIKAYNGSGAVKYSVAGGYTTVTGRAAVGSVTQSDGSTVVYEQGPTSDSFTVVLLSQPASNVTVSVVPVDGCSISSAAARINLAGSSGPGQSINLTFTNSNWNIPQTVTVWAVDDSVIQGQGVVLVNFDVVSSDPVFNGGGIPSVGVTVVDNDLVGIYIQQTGGSTAVSEQGPTSDQYTAVLQTSPTANVVISLAADYNQITVSPATLTFTTANWSIAQTVTVTAIDDNIFEGGATHTRQIVHTVESGDSAYNGLPVPNVVVTITDNECGAWGYNPMDFNKDCRVDFKDMATFAENWLKCTQPFGLGCAQ